MNLFRKLSASVSASLNNAVGRIENHDAIIEVSIREQKSMLAKTKARLKTLHNQQKKFEEDKLECEKQIKLWTERAKSIANSEKDKALQCLARRKQVQQKLTDTEKNLKQQQELTTQVKEKVRELELKIEEVSRQHNLMRARQTVADANASFGNSVSKQDHLDEVFERWESSVVEYESQPIFNEKGDMEFDDLANDFNKKEQKEQLNNELDTLLAEIKNSEDKDNV